MEIVETLVSDSLPDISFRLETRQGERMVEVSGGETLSDLTLDCDSTVSPQSSRLKPKSDRE